MRVSPSVAAIALLVLLLTWLSWCAVNVEAERFDRALGALDRLAMAESALDRDVLRARAGMLRNYDVLVRDITAMDDALTQLRAAASDRKTAAPAERLAASLSRREALVEQFKSDNALLQNSLAFFERFSGRLASPEASGPVPVAVSALAAAILRLSLDTSPERAQEVQDRLVELDRAAAASGDGERLQGLLAHGRLLHQLLPATDGILRSSFALAAGPDQAGLRATILTQQKASRRTARRYRLLLYLTSLLLVALLVRLGLQLRRRARALARRAAFEHIVSGISMRFIGTRPQTLEDDIDHALAEMADGVGADRAYFLVSGPTGRRRFWCRPGMALPPGWPDHARELASRFEPSRDALVHVPDVDRLAPGPERDDCLALGLSGWACAVNLAADGGSILLGFDMVRQASRIMETGELGLLRMARDTIANAVARSSAEAERMRLETRLHRARRLETVGALASGVAHNFNNIIGAILGYTEIAEVEGPADASFARSLGQIRQAGERARDLVDQILEFGRGRKARRRLVSIRDMVAEATSLLRASLPPQVDLAVGDVPAAATVCGEPVQLQQLIVNFARNGAQAMDDTGTVAIAADLQELARTTPLSHGELPPGRYVRIAVSDNGPGISKPMMERIFEPFFTTRPTGHGLGLATVREIVREHGGAMHVWSAPGEGSRFEAWLPCVASPGPPAGDDTSAAARGRGETLLVVDGDRERLLGSEDLLAALGYEPVGFVDGEEALRSCRRKAGRYDACVLGGLASPAAALALAAALRELAPELPLLLTTRCADELAPADLVAAGVSEVIVRPLAAAELAGALQRCLRQKSGHRRRLPVAAPQGDAARAPSLQR